MIFLQVRWWWWYFTLALLGDLLVRGLFDLTSDGLGLEKKRIGFVKLKRAGDAI